MKPFPWIAGAAVLGIGMGVCVKWRFGSAMSAVEAMAGPTNRPPIPRSTDAEGRDIARRVAISALPRPTLDELKAAGPGAKLGLLIRWLSAATAEEVASLAHAWFGESRDGGTAQWHLVALRWVELDPTAAVAFGRGYTDRYLRTTVDWDSRGIALTTPLHAVYRAWGKRDPDAALASLAQEPRKYRKHLATGLAGMVDEERARAWALAHPELHEFAGWRADTSGAAPLDMSNPAKAAAELRPDAPYFQAAHIAGEWMKTDPDAALAWARGLADSKQRRHALQSVMHGFLATEPARARPLIDELPAGLGRAQVEARYAAALAKTDPEAALGHATVSLRGTARLEAIAGIAAERGKTDPLAALKMLSDHSIGDLDVGALNSVHVEGPHTGMVGSSGVSAVSEVLKAAAALNPAGVMQLLADTGTLRPDNRDGRDSTLGYTLFSEWAARDTHAAARWLAGQPTSPGTISLAELTADRWPAHDVAGLQSLATQFAPGDARDTVVAEAARRLVSADPAGALSWAAQTGGESAFSAAFRHLAESDPQSAVATYAESLTPPQQDAQRQTLTDQLARRSAADAIAFFESLPPEAQAGVKLHDTTRAYARQDPGAASEWIAALPPTAAKDTAISGLVEYLLSDAAEPDPVAAAHWAAASPDPEGRNRRLQRVAEAWIKRNPTGFRTAIADSGLPPNIQSALLNHAPRPQ